MPRKRKKKKKRMLDAESLQVELLDGATSTEVPVEPQSEPVVDPPPEPSPQSREGADRWAKAVGQLKPTHRGEGRLPERDGAGGGSRPEPAVEATEEVLSGASGSIGIESHANARDHAAAGVRPAGEPLARAKDLVERGRIHEAIDLYLGILTVNPSNLKAHNNLGVLFDELKQFGSALEHFEAAERLAPENVEILANFASTLTSLARYDQAEELLRRAQRLAPDDVQVRLGIGILYFRRGLYGQAETDLRWVYSRDGNNGPAYYYRGEALNRLGRFEEAMEALKRACELMPTDPRPFYTLGHLYDRTHQPQDAAEMYRRARELQSR